MATRDDVQVALRILRAGVPGEHPGIDEDTVNVWAGALTAWSLEVLVAAAEHWAEEEPKFPSLLEFVSACQRTARQVAAQRASIERPAGWIGAGDLQLAKCGECGGTDWVEVPDERHPQDVFVRPCSHCQPALYERYTGGHLHPGHDRMACADEACRKSVGKRK